jgi:hypothetical protein
MVKMPGNEFPAPWLNGRPIDAPNKIGLIDWYSQTDGYYPEPTEHDSRNSVLRIFRSQGSILFEDEFRSQNTADYDDLQTKGRVNRVFRAIEMMSKFKAAHEDGANLSTSVIRDSGIVWYDHGGNLLPHELMHHLRQIEDKLKKRSLENSPVRAFWMGQEIQRSKWASARPSTYHTNQNHPNSLDNPKSLTGATYYHEYNSGQLSYDAINQEHRSAKPSLTVTAYGLQNQTQQSHGWFNQGASLVNLTLQDPKQPLKTTFSRSIQPRSKPQLIWPRFVVLKPDLDSQSSSTRKIHSKPDRANDSIDSGCASGSLAPVTNEETVATNGDSEGDADDERSEYDGWQSEHNVDFRNPPEHRVLKFKTELQENMRRFEELEAEESVERLGGWEKSVLAWLDNVTTEGWTWEGRMRHNWWLEFQVLQVV